MDEQRWARVRGLRALLHDGVEHGSRFVQKHHQRAAAVPFDLLDQIPAVARPAEVVREVHDSVVGLSYESIRLVNRGVSAADAWVVERMVERSRESEER